MGLLTGMSLMPLDVAAATWKTMFQGGRESLLLIFVESVLG
jgi:hypothetical protein